MGVLYVSVFIVTVAEIPNVDAYEQKPREDTPKNLRWRALRQKLTSKIR